MAVWIPVGDGFIEADVIRWKEPVFRNRHYGKAARVGERLVTAEVLREADQDGWVYLLVRGSEALSANIGWSLSDVLLAPRDTEARRRLKTIVRGKAERLTWSDESARAVVTSQFLRDLDPAPRVVAGLDDFDDSEEAYSLRSAFNLAAAGFNRDRHPKPGEGSPSPHN
jgi:hypothetical protein